MTRKLQQGFQVIFTTNVVGRCSPGIPGESNQFLVKFHQVLSVQAVFAQKHSMCTDESVLQWSRKKVNEGWTWFFKSRKFPMLISFCMLSRSCTSSVACPKPDINQHCHSALPSWNTRPRLAWYISICKLVRVQVPRRKSIIQGIDARKFYRTIKQGLVLSILHMLWNYFMKWIDPSNAPQVRPWQFGWSHRPCILAAHYQSSTLQSFYIFQLFRAKA